MQKLLKYLQKNGTKFPRIVWNYEEMSISIQKYRKLQEKDTELVKNCKKLGKPQKQCAKKKCTKMWKSWKSFEKTAKNAQRCGGMRNSFPLPLPTKMQPVFA